MNKEAILAELAAAQEAAEHSGRQLHARFLEKIAFDIDENLVDAEPAD